MRQYQRVAHGISFLLAASACSSSKEPGMSPGDLDNPASIVAGKGGNVGDLKDLGRCVEGRANTSRVAPHVVLLLDGSCSMSTNYPANGSASVNECVENPNGRWSALRAALVDPQKGVVPKLQDQVLFGVVVFGGRGNSCPIQGETVKPALKAAAKIDAALPKIQPGQYTPTGPALDYVYDNVVEPFKPDADNAPQIVILATDGEPNTCDGKGANSSMPNYQPSIDAVKNGAKKHVTTYVISLADATGAFHDHLQELANLGNPAAMGKAKLYEPNSPQQLQSDLQALVGGAVGCDIALNGKIPAGSECSGTVTLNGAALGCNKPDGWKLLDERHIRLQGTACKTLTDKNGVVEARFPCESGFSPD